MNVARLVERTDRIDENAFNLNRLFGKKLDGIKNPHATPAGNRVICRAMKNHLRQRHPSVGRHRRRRFRKNGVDSCMHVLVRNGVIASACQRPNKLNPDKEPIGRSLAATVTPDDLGRAILEVRSIQDIGQAAPWSYDHFGAGGDETVGD